MDTVSGVSVGKGVNQVVVWDKDKNSTMTVSVKGRWIYGKKCPRPENIGNLVIPKKSQDDTNFVLILAVGDGCGKIHELSKEDERKPEMSRSVPLDLKPTDKVFAPDDHEWGIRLSPYNNDDFFIHECILIGKLKE